MTKISLDFGFLLQDVYPLYFPPEVEQVYEEADLSILDDPNVSNALTSMSLDIKIKRPQVSPMEFFPMEFLQNKNDIVDDATGKVLKDESDSVIQILHAGSNKSLTPETKLDSSESNSSQGFFVMGEKTGPGVDILGSGHVLQISAKGTTGQMVKPWTSIIGCDSDKSPLESKMSQMEPKKMFDVESSQQEQVRIVQQHEPSDEIETSQGGKDIEVASIEMETSQGGKDIEVASIEMETSQGGKDIEVASIEMETSQGGKDIEVASIEKETSQLTNEAVEMNQDHTLIDAEQHKGTGKQDERPTNLDAKQDVTNSLKRLIQQEHISAKKQKVDPKQLSVDDYVMKCSHKILGLVQKKFELLSESNDALPIRYLFKVLPHHFDSLQESFKESSDQNIFDLFIQICEERIEGLSFSGLFHHVKGNLLMECVYDLSKGCDESIVFLDALSDGLDACAATVLVLLSQLLSADTRVNQVDVGCL